VCPNSPESTSSNIEHPEGIFFGHDGRRWQIVTHDGDWQIAQNAPAVTRPQLPDPRVPAREKIPYPVP